MLINTKPISPSLSMYHLIGIVGFVNPELRTRETNQILVDTYIMGIILNVTEAILKERLC